MNQRKILLLFLSLFVLLSCDDDNTETSLDVLNLTIDINDLRRNLSSEFKDYWYAGKAELTSYELTQERYGELRQGTAVTIFVTEDFVPEKQVKADSYSETNIPVLKCNITKKFLTGIYPYSIMTSSFKPLSNKRHAVKVSASVQEWCGQVYMQMNNRDLFEIESRSYFESEGDQTLTLDKTWMEDELWSLIRINPGELPVGEITIIPSFEHLRLRHADIQAQHALTSMKVGDSISTYTIKYQDVQREVSISFNSSFPFEIEKWEELNGANSPDNPGLKTVAKRMKREQLDYWSKNANRHLSLRDSLGLSR